MYSILRSQLGLANSHMWLMATVLDSAALEHTLNVDYKVALLLTSIMNLPIRYPKSPWVCNIRLSYLITTHMCGKGKMCKLLNVKLNNLIVLKIKKEKITFLVRGPFFLIFLFFLVKGPLKYLFDRDT